MTAAFSSASAKPISFKNDVTAPLLFTKPSKYVRTASISSSAALPLASVAIGLPSAMTVVLTRAKVSPCGNGVSETSSVGSTVKPRFSPSPFSSNVAAFSCPASVVSSVAGTEALPYRSAPVLPSNIKATAATSASTSHIMKEITLCFLYASLFFSLPRMSEASDALKFIFPPLTSAPDSSLTSAPDSSLPSAPDPSLPSAPDRRNLSEAAFLSFLGLFLAMLIL